MKRGLVAAATLIVTLMGVTLIDAAPAAASVGCNSTGCNGKDPNAMGCSADAKTIDQYNDANGDTLELRKSTACWAAWVRFTSASYTFTGIVEGFTNPCHPEAYPSCWHSAFEAAPWGDSIHKVARWSNMVSFTYWTRVCEMDYYGVLFEATCTAEH
jgi:hypothetical protein